MLYDIFFILFSIAYLPYLLIKGKAHKDFLQRFGALPGVFAETASKRPVWIHTVSVGEVLASRQFVTALSRECKRPIVLSTTTKAGNDLAREIFGKDILKFYFPLDLTFVVKKTLNRIKPGIFVIFETEIWPNLIMELSRRNVPIVLLNGRISDHSYNGYKAVRFLFKRVLNRMSAFCMQTDQDRERMINIGAEPGRVKVTGNMKFDTSSDAGVSPETTLNKLGMNEGEKLLVAGSTHTGEDEIILDAYKGLLRDFPHLKLLIAPRHIERAGQIARLVLGRGFDFRMVSKPNQRNAQYAIRNTILILDTIGELKEIFSIATIVFMGGSLVKRGGHNIVEPALYAKPIVFGPHMSNFRDMARIFLENEACIQVGDAGSLKDALLDLLKNDEVRESMGGNAKRLVDKHRGATKRNLDEVLEKLR